MWFSEISKEDIAYVGGKGANLGEMFRANLPIPEGFVVTAQTYKEFIEKTNIKDKIIAITEKITDPEDTAKLQDLANEIQKLVLSTEIPNEIKEEMIETYDELCQEAGSASTVKSAEQILNSIKTQNTNTQKEPLFVAVRSSATAEDLPEASFAGQQATFLNIKGREQIVQAVRACWASLFTARAIYYRIRNGFPHDKVLIAVVVQKMVNSDTSGIMFSANPATSDMNEIIIEGGYGLGEAFVGGQVNGDHFEINKTNLEITNKSIQSQDWGYFRDPKTGETKKFNIVENKRALQKITEDQVIQLSKLAIAIENHYQKPQDMEWAIEGNRVYIVQSRAITTMQKVENELKKEKTEIRNTSNLNVLVSGRPASPGVAYGPVKKIENASELDKIQKGDVLVTAMTNPDMVPAMERAAAIVTDEGGMTCHAAIVSREMGTPCIVGTENATKILNDGMIITVDATHGHVYEGKIEIEKPVQQIAASVSSEPIETVTKVKVICDLPAYAKRAAEKNPDGVGLTRIEFMIVNAGVHPSKYIKSGREFDYIKILMNGLEGIAKEFLGKPIWVRTSDIRTDEYRNLEGGNEEPHESDPMIGWHGIRRGLDEDGILKAEFKAIKNLHDQGYTNIGIMLPFVIRVEEVQKAKQIMRDIGLEPCKDIEFGVMIETPASCWIIEDLCKEGINFISFGTNDLTQLTLGIDRNNERIASLYDELHPAVLGEIAKVIKVCRKYGVITSICGQAGSNPKMAEFLVKAGIDSISSNVDAIDEIRKTVSITEKKVVLDYVRNKLNE
jgi:pyruvate,water dikinase